MALFNNIGEELSELPVKAANLAKRVPGMLGRLPGRMSSAAKPIFGLESSGLSPEEEAFGMNPRRAYWSSALADLGSVVGGQGDPNTRMQTNQIQTQHQQQLKANEFMENYRSQMAMASLLNARKSKSTITKEQQNAAAMGLEPGSPEYAEYIRQVTTKPLVSMGGDVSAEFYSDIASRLPDARAEATKSQLDLSRFQVMETLIPHLGETGVGKELMVSFRSSLNQFGMADSANFIDALGEAAGIDVFDGDQGVQELFRALSSQDVIGRAKELYPVSNSDINLLREMVASLKINDKDAMRVLIDRGKQQAQIPIDRFNEYRGYMKNAPGEGFPEIPPLNDVPWLDSSGVTPDDDYDELRTRMLGPK